MKIKRTTAPDMRTAMKLIRDEQGPDAVILGNRRVPGGIEIVSAIDYEAGAIDSKNLFSDYTVQANSVEIDSESSRQSLDSAPSESVLTSATAITETPGSAMDSPRWDAHNKDDVAEAERSVRRATELLRAARAAAKPVEKPAVRTVLSKRSAAVSRTSSESVPQAFPPTASRAKASVAEPGDLALRAAEANALRPAVSEAIGEKQNTQITAMQQELQAMRELMTQQLNVMGWDAMTRRQPSRVNLLTRLYHMGIGAELALKLCDAVQSAADPRRNWRDALAMLQAQIPESREDMIEHGGVFALLGTTGVGKTSTIAKLAALCAMRHGKQSVALISADNMRVGAREQLRSFAAILDVPLVFSENAEQLEREVQRLRERRLVLIDTAGLGANDTRLGQSLAQIRRVKAINPILTLPANGQLGALQQSCRAFANADPVACVVSKVDEAHSMGALMTAVVEHQLPLTWLGTGQRVPEDLSLASAASLMRLSLGTEALRKPSRLDADELASHFGSSGSYESG